MLHLVPILLFVPVALFLSRSFCNRVCALSVFPPREKSALAEGRKPVRAILIPNEEGY